MGNACGCVDEGGVAPKSTAGKTADTCENGSTINTDSLNRKNTALDCGKTMCNGSSLEGPNKKVNNIKNERNINGNCASLEISGEVAKNGHSNNSDNTTLPQDSDVTVVNTSPITVTGNSNSIEVNKPNNKEITGEDSELYAKAQRLSSRLSTLVAEAPAAASASQEDVTEVSDALTAVMSKGELLHSLYLRCGSVGLLHTWTLWGRE